MLGQQPRRLVPVEVRFDHSCQILEHTPSLLRTRRYHCPDPLAPALPDLTACPLRYAPVDHHEAYRLFCQIVRWLHPRRRYEREVTRPILRQPLPHRLRVPGRRHVLRAAVSFDLATLSYPGPEEDHEEKS